MESEFDKKIAKLRGEYKSLEDQRYINEMEKRLRTNIARAKLKERPEVQGIIMYTKARIDAINYLLTYDKTLNEPTEDAARRRTRLFDERDIHQLWLERLDGSQAGEALKNVENIINSLLKE